MEMSATKLLTVNLDNGEISRQPIPEDWFRLYLGSRGINARILWDYAAFDLDALDPRSPLIMSAGTLTGTNAPGSGRCIVTCKSPASGLYLKSSTGGHWGAQLRFAGYFTIVVVGRAKQPCYIYINNDQVEIRDAGDCWGLDVRHTTEHFTRQYGGDTQVCCIGPAGENLVNFASIMYSIYNAAGRGGAGAVMGSKLLKAIVVRGDKPLRVARPQAYYELCQDLRVKLSQDTGSQNLSHFGTANIVNTVNAIGALSVQNFRKGYLEGAYTLSGQYLNEANYLKRRISCGACGTGCHRYTTVDKGKYQGSYSGGPEFETVAGLGAGCLITDTDAVLRANELCNILGMDTVSAAGVIQWAMECWEKGLISAADTDGMDFTWGNTETMVDMLPRLAYRQGFGDILADGTRLAAQKIGGDSWKWAVQAKGLEQTRVEIRHRKGYSLAFAVNLRGPDHLHTECVAESARTPEAKDLILKITGDLKYATPYITEKRAEIVRWHEDCYTITDCLGLCAFATTLAFAINPENMAQMFSLCTGIGLGEQEAMGAGRRVLNVEKCLNVMYGADRSDDVLPYRMMYEPLMDTNGKVGMVTSPQQLDGMLDEYYGMHGWDRHSSWPTPQVLKELELEDVAQLLQAKGKTPESFAPKQFKEPGGV